MAVTITLDDHVAKSVERGLESILRIGSREPDFLRDIAVALDVLAPALVEAEGRRALRGVGFDLGPIFDPHAPNAHDALDDGWGNDGG